MNDADRAALDAWKDYRAAQDMLHEAAGFPGRVEFVNATRIAHDAFGRWAVALGHARAPLDVATLKGGR